MAAFGGSPSMLQCTSCGANATRQTAQMYAPQPAPLTLGTNWEERERRRRERGAQTLDRLAVLGAPVMAQHPLGHRLCFTCWPAEVTWLAASLRNRRGVLMSYVFCGRCGEKTPKGSLPHSILNPARLPVFQSNACNACGGPGCRLCSIVCSVNNCGAYDTHGHHSLPHHIADPAGLNANDWPVIFLCRAHHTEWHRLVTPDMARVGRESK